MSQFFQPQQPNAPYGQQSANDMQFYPSSYTPGPVSGHATPSQAAYGYGIPPAGQGYGAGAAGGFNPGFGAPPGATGRMGEQGGLRTGWLAAFGTEGYDHEPPLLEELGINFAHIQSKTLAVLNPLARIDQHIMDDSDLAGPILFFLLFGFLLYVSGKSQFGYIYGLAFMGSITLHMILSLMSPPPDGSPSSAAGIHDHVGALSSTLTLPRSASVLGYCLLPLVITSLIGIVVPMDSMLGYVLTALAIVWCTYSSSAMFCVVGRMRAMRGLVAYPLALFYGCFGLMEIFSSRGVRAV